MPRIHTRFRRLLASAFTALALLFSSGVCAEEPFTLRYENSQGHAEVIDFSDAKLTAVHFWATWCTPCVAELPELDGALRTYKDAGFRVAAISLDNDMTRVTSFFQNYAIKTLKPMLDYRTQAFQSLHISGLPTTVFFNSKGEEISRVEGPMHWLQSPNKDFIENHLK